jgi:hypothetical protein
MKLLGHESMVTSQRSVTAAAPLDARQSPGKTFCFVVLIGRR